MLVWRRGVVEIATSPERKSPRESVRCCREDVLFFFEDGQRAAGVVAWRNPDQLAAARKEKAKSRW